MDGTVHEYLPAEIVGPEPRLPVEALNVPADAPDPAALNVRERFAAADTGRDSGDVGTRTTMVLTRRSRVAGARIALLMGAHVRL